MGFIYKITNTKNNKIYIGKTIGSINKRWREHKSNALNKTDNYLLHLVMRKYGIENFIIEIVEECPNELLNEKEIYYIKFFNSYIGQDKNKNCGYNMTPGGEGKDYDSYDKIFELWDAGNSISQIASKIKYNRDTIRRILIDYENYSIEEIQFKTGSVLFKAYSKEFIASVSAQDSYNSYIKIIPADNNYNFAPSLIQKLHNYIEINNSTIFQKIL